MRIEIILTKEENEICNTVETFNNLFLIDSNVTIDKFNSIYKYNQYEVKYICTTQKIDNDKERLFHITLDSIEEDDELSLESLRQISRNIRKHIKESKFQFTENIIWDEVSQYYCKKGYPLVNEIENLMRKLIYLFIIRNVGSTWLSNSSPVEFRDKLKNNVTKRNNVQVIDENILYEADFIQLSEFLFTEYSTITVNELYTEIQKDNEIVKLREYLPKSNWQRYFESHIPVKKLDEDWNKLYSLRNMVAHNKLINKGDFDNLQTLSTKIKSVLLEAINNIQIVTVPKNEVAKVVSLVESTVRVQKYNTYYCLKLSNPERKCFLCDGVIDNASIHIEHVIPVRLLGEVGRGLWNKVEVHPYCNMKKKDKMTSEELIIKLNQRNETWVSILESAGIEDEKVYELRDFVENKKIWNIWDKVNK